MYKNLKLTALVRFFSDHMFRVHRENNDTITNYSSDLIYDLGSLSKARFVIDASKYIHTFLLAVVSDRATKTVSFNCICIATNKLSMKRLVVDNEPYYLEEIWMIDSINSSGRKGM